MREIVKVEKINNLLTIDIVGCLMQTHIGDIINDNVGNAYRLDSIALSGSARKGVSTLVVTQLYPSKKMGEYIISE